MDDTPRTWFGIRDLFWLTILAPVLAAWGWDRGRLASRIELLGPVLPGKSKELERMPASVPPGGTGIPAPLPWHSDWVPTYEPPPHTMRQGFQLDRF